VKIKSFLSSGDQAMKYNKPCEPIRNFVPEQTSQMNDHQFHFRLPQGEELSLRPVTEADEAFLLAVYGRARADELAQVEWEAGQKDLFVKWQFELQRSEYNARFPDAEYYVILLDDCPAGRIWIGADEHEMRLLDIALLPEFQKRGAGTALIRWLIDKAERAAKTLRHMVFVHNNNAHRFYERLGFVVIEDLGAYKHMEWKESEPPAVTDG
jgi:ribosomal protein S18 acetylase RimI-like enzyme